MVSSATCGDARRAYAMSMMSLCLSVFNVEYHTKGQSLWFILPVIQSKDFAVMNLRYMYLSLRFHANIEHFL